MMSVDFSCFMEIAKSSTEKSGEQWTRNAVSRAYYSMYHSALRVVHGDVPCHDKCGVKVSGGVHARLFAYLCDGEAAEKYKLDPNVLKKLGLKLKTYHFHRVTADYKLDQKMQRLTAVMSISEAEEVDRLVSDLLKQHK
ncbi:hypothetical protein [Klebsiella variicola]|uniref:hypothetical protein n=1 Tax=Klebsiella variicola TaxID=244366 RepID=UPI001E2EE9DC|nr:hypothetical protein [Klebsiella variicola]MCE0520573.1 hypothetical protein [Klebsiella variicola]